MNLFTVFEQLLFSIPIVICAILLISYIYGRLKKGASIENKHVVITGGSSGIGKSIALKAAKSGAHVTIIARDLQRLKSVTEEIKLACGHETQKVQYLSLDLSKDYASVEKSLVQLEEEVGPIYMLVNCAGAAVLGKLEDTSETDIRNQIGLNLLGTIYPTKALIGRMKARSHGIVVITGSVASLIGIYGQTIYTSTKFALRGFAEALHMETKHSGISVTLALPPDTDTPGFANEMKSKPIETQLISESAGLWNPDCIGDQILKDALQGHFFSYVGFESAMACITCSGMSPIPSVTNLIFEIFLMGILRAVSAGYHLYFDGIIRRCLRERNKAK